MPLRAASIAAAVGLVALVGAILVLGSRAEPHRLATNGVRPLIFVADIPPGQEVCQSGETVPERTAGVWLRVGAYGKATPQLTVSFNGRPAGSLAGGWREGDVVVPVRRVDAERTNVKLCLGNGGPATVTMAGEHIQGGDATLGNEVAAGRMRIEYEPDGNRSWWQIAPWVAERMTVVRSAVPGIAALPLYIVLALLVVGGAVALVLREARA